MRPAARLEAAIALLEEIARARQIPADATALQFFRHRRFIGSSDRREISERVWRILRTRRRLAWWLGLDTSSARLSVAADFLFAGARLENLAALCDGARFAPAPLSAPEQAALRRLEGHSLDHPAMPTPVRHEVQDWLLPHLTARFGAALGAELDALNQPAPLDLRVNLLQGTREEAVAALAAEGIKAVSSPFSPVGLRIATRAPITTGASFRRGLVEIQDEGSQLVALAVGAEPGMRVADVCAGAGGKTLALATAMHNQGRIVACDVSERRLDAAVRRLRRARAFNVERHLLDAAGYKWAKRSQGTFDRVLADAPCTGSGTWRRHPDARARFGPADLTEIVTRQAAILEFAAGLVRKGGRLVYATCSLLLEENEAQVESFVARHAEFAITPLAAVGGFASRPPPGAGPFLFLTPLRSATDGFFAAVLERVG